MLDLSDSIKTSRPEEVRINCPFCESRGKTPDTKYKMYVNVQRLKINCFRCGFSHRNAGGLLGGQQDDIPTSFLDGVEDKLESLFSVFSISEHNMDEIGWKLSPDKTPIAYNYIISRGFTNDEIRHYDLYVGKDYEIDGKVIKKWSGRILFPYKDSDGKVLFVVGRSYSGKEPKYINSSGNRSHAIYGLEFVDGVAAACEGIIDAISFKKHTAIPGVCGLGKEYTEEQVQRISSKCHTIFEALDGDVDEDIRGKLCMQFLKYGVKVKNLNLPKGEDPNSLAQQLNGFVSLATDFNPFNYIFRSV